MLCLECVEADNARTTRKFIERSVALTQGEHVLFGNVRKEFAETPDTALGERFQESLAMNPQSLKSGRVVTPFRENEFQQVATTGAAEVLGGGSGLRAAGNAAEASAGFGDLRD
jgi:hypothetical protein